MGLKEEILAEVKAEARGIKKKAQDELARRLEKERKRALAWLEEEKRRAEAEAQMEEERILSEAAIEARRKIQEARWELLQKVGKVLAGRKKAGITETNEFVEVRDPVAEMVERILRDPRLSKEIRNA